MSSTHFTAAPLSRRAFLRFTALGAGVLTVAACAPVQPSQGGAGASAPAPAAAAIKFLTQGGG